MLGLGQSNWNNPFAVFGSILTEQKVSEEDLYTSMKRAHEHSIPNIIARARCSYTPAIHRTYGSMNAQSPAV